MVCSARTICMTDLSDQSTGNVDVPVSVWVDHHCIERDLPAGLLAFYTPPPDGLVLDALGVMAEAATAAGRRCITLIPGDPGDVSTEATSGASTRLVDVASLPGTVAAFTAEVALIVASREAAAQAGWWPAVQGALRPGGHVAIVCGTADVDTHASIMSGAISTGLSFTQHLVITSSKALDDAVAAEATTTDARRGRTKTHRRRHRDVYVFTNSTPPPAGTGRRAAA